MVVYCGGMEASDTEGSPDADLAEAAEAHAALRDLETRAGVERELRDAAIRRAIDRKATMYGAAKYLTEATGYRITEQAVRRIRDRG